MYLKKEQAFTPQADLKSLRPIMRWCHWLQIDIFQTLQMILSRKKKKSCKNESKKSTSCIRPLSLFLCYRSCRAYCFENNLHLIDYFAPNVKSTKLLYCFNVALSSALGVLTRCYLCVVLVQKSLWFDFWVKVDRIAPSFMWSLFQIPVPCAEVVL